MNIHNNEVISYFLNLDIISIIDIIIAVLIVWQVLNFLAKTRGLQIAKGLVFIYIFQILSSTVKFKIASELFGTISKLLYISLPVVFQREIRVMLESFGRLSLTNKKNSIGNQKVLNEIKDALEIFSKEKVGALIILERSTPLDEFANSGVLLGSEISTELLECIFKNESALHDGAVLIRNGKILAAKCILPLNEDTDAKSQLGTRHRAAIGLSEVSDSISIVVSEETRAISIAFNGKIKRINDIKELNKELIDITSNKIFI